MGWLLVKDAWCDHRLTIWPVLSEGSQSSRASVFYGLCLLIDVSLNQERNSGSCKDHRRISGRDVVRWVRWSGLVWRGSEQVTQLMLMAHALTVHCFGRFFCHPYMFKFHLPINFQWLRHAKKRWLDVSTPPQIPSGLFWSLNLNLVSLAADLIDASLVTALRAWATHSKQKANIANNTDRKPAQVIRPTPDATWACIMMAR